MAIKLVAVLLVFAAVTFAGYWFDTKQQIQDLENSKAKEEKLKKDYEKKQLTASNLTAYKKQMEQMKNSFEKLLLQLPGKTEIAGLLEDINRVGLDSGLEFELFKPGKEKLREFYAEKPIDIKVVGTYHQLGNFASGVAALPRIVTMHNLKIDARKGVGKKGSSSSGDLLSMQVTANTYRYLDKSEQPKKRSGKKKRKRR